MTNRFLATLAVAAIAVAAMPVAAQSPNTISVTGRYGVGVVFDNSNVRGMQPLPGGVSDLNHAGNPAFVDSLRACAIGRGANYAIENATARLIDDPRQPTRRAVCTQINNGRFQLAHPYGRNVDLAAVDSQGNVRGWIADDTVTPYHN